MVEKFDDTDICIMYEENPVKVWCKSLTVQIPNQLLTHLHSDVLLILKVNQYILQSNTNTNKVLVRIFSYARYTIKKVLDPEAQSRPKTHIAQHRTSQSPQYMNI